MQSGELLVTGKDSVDIELRDHPDEVEVKFIDDIVIVPCDHHHHDNLQWEVRRLHRTGRQVTKHHRKHFYVLTITWQVTGVRKICWEACY
jgi:hypothetical protein